MSSQQIEQQRMSQELLDSIPSEIGLLPLRGTLVYPGMLVPLLVGRPSSVKLVDDVLVNHRFLLLVTQKEASIENPSPEDLYQVGTVAVVLKMSRQDEDSMQVIVQGIARATVLEFTQRAPYFRVRIQLYDPESVLHVDSKSEALVKIVQDSFGKLIQHTDQLPKELMHFAASLDHPGKLADLVAVNLNIDLAQKQHILEILDPNERLQYVHRLLIHELEVAELAAKIQEDVRKGMDEAQREMYLRKKLAAIQKELGVDDPQSEALQELREKIEEADLPEDAREAAEQELDRIAHMHPSSAEYTVARTYLDWLTELPWSKSSEDCLDIEVAREVLEADHYGLKKVKDRILEYLAVRTLKADMQGPILCLVGPPGVGKTSLGRSIADAMKREFVRLSLGGVRDEAEIRGHRRTYVGALPGRIIQSLRQAQTNNPVFMLDEIDKLGVDFQGDPASALLEVLDPDQNHTFVDHYLDVPFDLSKILFIATANMIDAIPTALRDRMEIIPIPGYTEFEKLRIAERYLVPRQIEAHGLERDQVDLPDQTLSLVIRHYTREAGVRQLEREIATIVRKIARRVAEGEDGKFVIDTSTISEYLGVPRFHDEVAEVNLAPGIAVGLAWTPTGGDVIFVEATKMSKVRPGTDLCLTGQLGDVMQESAQAALSYIRSHAEELGIDTSFFNDYEVHLHVPSGGVPKDGPSAGLTMAATLASLATGRQVRDSLAMTGEISLRGKVLPVDGIKEKALAADRLGIKTVILPLQNEKDLVELPPEVRESLHFELVDDIQDAFNIALKPGKMA